MSRIHLALGVDDVEAATAFSARLSGVEPAGTRPGYANSAIADPPLELVLLEEPGQGGALDHLGVEVGSGDELDAEQVRAGPRVHRRAGFHLLLRAADRVLGRARPGAVRREVHTVLADSPTSAGDAAPAAAGDRDAPVTAGPRPPGGGRR